MEGKKTIITDGCSEIGKAVALAFAQEGADVAISYLKSEENDAQETVRLIEDAGRKAVTAPGDLRDEAICQRVVDTAVRKFGRIDVLVSNAAYQMSQDGGIADTTTEQFDRVMTILRSRAGSPPWRAKHRVDVRLHDHHDLVDPGFLALAAPVGLRNVEGRDRQLHQGPRRGPGREGHPGQLGRSRTGVDAADPGDNGRGEGRVVRGEVPDGRAPSPPSWPRATCFWPPRSRASSPPT